LWLVEQYWASRKRVFVVRRRIAFGGLPPHAYLGALRKVEPKPAAVSLRKWKEHQRKAAKKLRRGQANRILLARAQRAALRWQSQVKRKNNGT